MANLSAKGRALISKKDNINAPKFDVDNYKLSMINNLNFYRLEVDQKKLKDFALTYWSFCGNSISELSKLNESCFSLIGSLSHMHHIRNVGFNDSDISKLNTLFSACLEKNQQKEEVVVTQKPKKIEHDNTPELIGELEGFIDDLILSNKEADIKQFLFKTGIKPAQLDKISQFFTKRVSELSLISTGDGQMKEGYKNLGFRKLNKLISFISQIVELSNSAANIKKVTKIVTTKKAKLPSVAAKNVKYMRVFEALKLRSIDAAKIVNSSCVVLYNTERRKLIKVVALDGNKLTVQGSSIKNFDMGLSTQKTLRKPELQLEGVQLLTKKPFEKMFKEINSTESKFSGRISDKMIILSAF